jgi:nitrogen fixation/metabolism regulation signal transduction histidine kinase
MRHAQLTPYDMNSNELKAAKRRIYRQRQKTEEHRQILRCVLTFTEATVYVVTCSGVLIHDDM